MGALLDLALAAVEGGPPRRVSSSVLERRRAKVEYDLARHPEQYVSVDVVDAPLRPEPGDPVSVVIACRTAVGIVSAELVIPRERFDPAPFFKTLEETSRRPS